MQQEDKSTKTTSVAADMIIMSCRYFDPGARYVRHLSDTAEMYARTGFIGSPIELRAIPSQKNALG
jgi:hypothetical protein